MSVNWPPQGDHFKNDYMTTKGIFQRHAVSTITKFITYTNKFSDSENLMAQSGVIYNLVSSISS